MTRTARYSSLNHRREEDILEFQPDPGEKKLARYE
jgi:hypothetical protein